MKLPPVLVLLAVLLSQQVSPSEGFKIAAFNIQQLGRNKIRNARFTAALANFICGQDWDIVFLQELTNQAVLNTLTTTLNTNRECMTNGPYTKVFSPQLPTELPTASGKEIYAYLYRRNKVSRFTADVRQEQITQYQVDGQTFSADVFFRSPFVAQVEVNTRAVPELACMPKFVLIGIHTRPARTYSELNGLVNVYNWARRMSANALILGDLNADCGTFGPVEKQKSVLYNARRHFKWLVNDRVKTNPGSRRSCAYDRLIAAGAEMKQTALVGNVQVPRWTGLRLSDHWPVSVDLKCPSKKRRRSESRSRSGNKRCKRTAPSEGEFVEVHLQGIDVAEAGHHQDQLHQGGGCRRSPSPRNRRGRSWTPPRSTTPRGGRRRSPSPRNRRGRSWTPRRSTTPRGGRRRSPSPRNRRGKSWTPPRSTTPRGGRRRSPSPRNRRGRWNWRREVHFQDQPDRGKNTAEFHHGSSRV